MLIAATGLAVLAVPVDSGAVGEAGSARSSFNFKGVVYVCNEGDKCLSKDEALEKAIEAGAEEVIDGCDDDERPALMVGNVTCCCFVSVVLFNTCLLLVRLLGFTYHIAGMEINVIAEMYGTGYSSLQLASLGAHMPCGITQCYLPSGRGDIPALTPAKAGT